MNHEPYFDGDGRLQMPSEEWANFAAYLAYLKENEVPCDVGDARVFLAEGRPYGNGHLHHP